MPPARASRGKEGLIHVTKTNWQTRAALRGSAASFALSIALIAGAAQAQTAAAEADADTIIVTGTLIANPALERATPVTVTNAAEMELKASNTAEQVLREIPGIVPSIGSAVNNGNGGSSYVNLRGLGSNRNIVLLDGDRLTPADLNGRFDLNNVPLALVERVEVLTGGASTTYGADAVSGVVNFITKRDFAGVEATLNSQITERGDGFSFRADVVTGANFDDGRGNVVLGIGYQHVDPVYQGDRGFSAGVIDGFAGVTYGSGTSSPARFSNTNPTGGNWIQNFADPNLPQVCNTNGYPEVPGLPNCSNFQAGSRQITADGTAFRPTAAFDPYNFNPWNIFQTPFKRFNIYAAGRYEISDAVEIYSRAIFSKNVVSTIIAPSGAFTIPVVINLNNPYLTVAQRNAFCAYDLDQTAAYQPRFSPEECAAAAAATGPDDPNYRTVNSTINRRATEFGPRVSDFTTTYFDYQVGARGGITDTINWDISASYGESENNQVQQGYWLNSRVRQALLANNKETCIDSSNGCVPLNLFGADGTITPQMNQFLSANSQVNTKVTMTQVKGLINGDFGWQIPMASNPIAFAIGGEYRSYTAMQQSDLLSQSGDLGGAGGASPNVSGGFKSYEAVGEIVVPLLQDRPFFEDLTLEAGVRYSKYNVEAPNKPSFETWTWKAGGSWSPGAGLKIRGNYSRAVRAPNISELFYPVVTALTNLSDDPCASNDPQGSLGRPVPSGELLAICLAQGAPPSQIGSIMQPDSGQVNYTGGGNLFLKPETSKSWTVGAVFQPDFAPRLSISVDYYNIKVHGAITTPTPGDVIAACFGPNPLSPPAGAASTEACTGIRRNGITGALSGDYATTPGLPLALSNLGYLATDGIDFQLNYRHDFNNIGWALAVVGNWTNKSVFQSSPTGEPRDCVGLYSVDCGSIQPSWQWQVRNTLMFGDIDVSLLWRYISRVEYEYGDAFVGKINAPGTSVDGQEADFNFIPAYHMFDLTARAAIGENLTLTFGIQNLFDRQPKVVGMDVGPTSYNSGNVYPSTYDALGRRYSVTARLRF